jgi:hypothetical protein
VADVFFIKGILNVMVKAGIGDFRNEIATPAIVGYLLVGSGSATLHCCTISANKCQQVNNQQW